MELTMSFGASVRAKRIAEGIGLNDFADRLGVSPAYWSRVEREQENPPRDELVEKAAAILGVRLDDLFVEAGRLPPDMRQDLKQVVHAYRRRRRQLNPR
jgi:transcriptional regulator with XRE-family HTH domain